MRLGKILLVSALFLFLLGCTAPNAIAAVSPQPSSPISPSPAGLADETSGLPNQASTAPPGNQGGDSAAASSPESLAPVNALGQAPTAQVKAAAPAYVDVRFTVGKKSMKANGKSKTLEAAPVISGGRTMLPIRDLAEAIGAKVTWVKKTGAATVILGPSTMVLWVGKREALINGVPIPIDPTNLSVMPVVRNGRTLLPLRFITENLGVQVSWNRQTGAIGLKSGGTGGAPTGWFRVTGVVCSSSDGEPLAGVQPAAKADLPPPYTFTATTNNDGTYTMDLPATSSFSITLTASGYETKKWRVNAAGCG